jgi:hypothetical protein
MLKRLFFSLSIVFVYSLLCTSVHGNDRSLRDQPQLYTNQDIERYKTPSEVATTAAKSAPQEDREEGREVKKQRIREDHEKDYWCKKASAYKEKIEKAGETVKEMEKKLSEEKSKSLRTSKKNTPLQKRLVKARKQVTAAEKDLDDLEHEAHRKGIPPGWLRCQL